MEGCCIKNRSINQDPDRKDHGHPRTSMGGFVHWGNHLGDFPASHGADYRTVLLSPRQGSPEEGPLVCSLLAKDFFALAESLYFMPQYVTKT